MLCPEKTSEFDLCLMWTDIIALGIRKCNVHLPTSHCRNPYLRILTRMLRIIILFTCPPYTAAVIRSFPLFLPRTPLLYVLVVSKKIFRVKKLPSDMILGKKVSRVPSFQCRRKTEYPSRPRRRESWLYLLPVGTLVMCRDQTNWLNKPNLTSHYHQL